MSSSTTTRTPRTDWRQRLAVTIWSGLITVTAILWLRGLAGALPTRLPPAMAGLLAIVLLLLGLLACSLARTDKRRSGPIRLSWRSAALSVLPGLVAGGLLLPLDAAWARLFLPAMAIIASLVALSADRVARPTTIWLRRGTLPPTASFEQRVDAPALVLQQSTRQVDESGRDRQTGLLRLRLDPGERTACVHLSFCPPFGGTPAVECQVAGEADARIKVTGVRSFGARIEVRCPRSGPETVVLEIAYEVTAAVPVRAA